MTLQWKKQTSSIPSANVKCYYHRSKRKNNPRAALAAQGQIRGAPKIRFADDPHLPPTPRFDPAHGGMFPDAIGTNPFVVREKDLTLAISLAPAKILRKQGHQIVLTRNRDVHLSTDLMVDLARRAEVANDARAQLFVSVHCNAYSDAKPEGIETYYCSASPRSERLASAVQEALLASFADHLNRGIKARDLLVLESARMPACQVEAEFLTNPVQLEFLSSERNQQAIAQVISFLKVKSLL